MEEQSMKIMELPKEYLHPFPAAPDCIYFWKREDDLRYAGASTQMQGQWFRQVQMSHPNRQPTLKEILAARKIFFEGKGVVMLMLPESDYFRWDQTRTFVLLQSIPEPNLTAPAPEVTP